MTVHAFGGENQFERQIAKDRSGSKHSVEYGSYNLYHAPYGTETSLAEGLSGRETSISEKESFRA